MTTYGWICARCRSWVEGQAHVCYQVTTNPTSTYTQPIDLDALAKKVAEMVKADLTADVAKAWHKALVRASRELDAATSRDVRASRDVGAE